MSKLSKKRQEATIKLAQDLEKIASESDSSISLADAELLTLIASEAAKGVDIRTRYSTFYQKLLADQKLRELFLDILHTPDNSVITSTTSSNQTLLINKLLNQPIVKTHGKDGWQVSWQRTIEQLQRIFSPSKLAYRSDANPFETPTFMLLKEEVIVQGLSYEVTLTFKFSQDNLNALSVFLIIVSFEDKAKNSFPLAATLSWGSYSQTIQVIEQGLSQFPDLVFTSSFDEEGKTIRSDLNLTIEKNSE